MTQALVAIPREFLSLESLFWLKRGPDLVSKMDGMKFKIGYLSYPFFQIVTVDQLCKGKFYVFLSIISEAQWNFRKANS